jgi:hypothetical protein
LTFGKDESPRDSLVRCNRVGWMRALHSKCRYFFFSPQPDLVVVQEEKSFSYESRPLEIPTPTVWRLTRERYIVEIALEIVTTPKYSPMLGIGRATVSQFARHS